MCRLVSSTQSLIHCVSAYSQIRSKVNSTPLAALAELHKRTYGTRAVIHNSRGEPLVGPRFWFEPAVLTAKMRGFTWHCLRHTFASRLVMAGVDLRTVQNLMGHKTIAMTVRYSHLAPTHTLAPKLAPGAVKQVPAETAYVH